MTKINVCTLLIYDLNPWIFSTLPPHFYFERRTFYAILCWWKDKKKKSKKTSRNAQSMNEKTKIIERKKNPTLLNQLLAIPFFTVICITYYNLEAIYDSFYFNKSRSLENEHDNNFEQCSVFFLRVIRPEQGVFM